MRRFKLNRLNKPSKPSKPGRPFYKPKVGERTKEAFLDR